MSPVVRDAAGLDDAGIVELGAAVVHYVSFNNHRAWHDVGTVIRRHSST
jgi:hypothetical protein